MKYLLLLFLITASASANAQSDDLRPCADSIKQKMLLRELQFVDSDKTRVDDYATFANKTIKNQLTEVEYSVSLDTKTRDVGGVGITFSYPTPTKDQIEINAEFAANLSMEKDHNGQWPLALELSLETFKNGVATSFSQQFNINKKCELRLVETKHEIIKRVPPHTFDIEKRAWSIAGGDELPKGIKQTFSGTYIWSREIPFPEKDKDIEHFINKLMGATIIMPGFDNPITAVLKSLPRVQSVYNLQTKKNENMRTVSLQLKANNEDMMVFNIYVSKNSNYHITSAGPLEDHSVNQSVWLSSQLIKKVSFSTVETKVDPKLFLQPGLMLLKLSTSEPYAYPNIQMYWSVLGTKPLNGKDGLNIQYNLKQAPRQPIMATSTFAAPYADTKYVQTSLPTIKLLRAKLLQNFKGNRWDMALRVLNVVHENLVVDKEMLADNTVLPLTTAVILQRKKGVCQHFANLYAALARSVGLPTRIITGYNFDDGTAGAHAWNEIEVSPGIWVPVEPQHPDFETDFSAYLPLSISTILDDGNQSSDSMKEIRALSLTNYRFEGGKSKK